MSSVLDHRVRVPPPATPLAEAPAGQKALDFDMQKQKQEEWCWATISSSVATYYGDAAGRKWTQCHIVNVSLGETTCCTEGGTTRCNRPFQPEKALALVGHLDRDFGGALSMEQIAEQVAAGRPIGVCIDWTGGGGHVVAVDGYDAMAGMIDVKDSLFGPSTVPLSSFPAHYQGGGAWGWTYLTR